MLEQSALSQDGALQKTLGDMTAGSKLLVPGTDSDAVVNKLVLAGFVDVKVTAAGVEGERESARLICD